MVFDLGLAMRKKGEFETARLLDFEFRRRVRATWLLAQSLGIAKEVAIDLVVTTDEADTPARLAALASISADDALSEYHRLRSVAHQELVAELGDPTPHRLG